MIAVGIVDAIVTAAEAGVEKAAKPQTEARAANETASQNGPSRNRLASLLNPLKSPVLWKIAKGWKGTWTRRQNGSKTDFVVLVKKQMNHPKPTSLLRPMERPKNLIILRRWTTQRGSKT